MWYANWVANEEGRDNELSMEIWAMLDNTSNFSVKEATYRFHSKLL